METDEGPLMVLEEELKYKVAIHVPDGTWVVRAAFSRMSLAKAYISGMAAGGIEARVCWDDDQEPRTAETS